MPVQFEKINPYVGSVDSVPPEQLVGKAAGARALPPSGCGIPTGQDR